MLTDTTAKPRTSRSSKPNSEPIETASAKRHRKATPVNTSEKTAASEQPVPPVSAAIDPVGADVVVPVMTTETIETITVRTVTHTEIAHLAHSFWVERGSHHGSPEEDWLRAERVLTMSASAGK